MADSKMEGKAKADKKEKGKKRQSVSGEQESKEAKKKAMAVDIGVSKAGPSSAMSRLVSSKSELEVARLLDPDLEDDHQVPGSSGVEQEHESGEQGQRSELKPQGKPRKEKKEKKEKKERKEKEEKRERGAEPNVEDDDQGAESLGVQSPQETSDAMGAEAAQANGKMKEKKSKKKEKEQGEKRPTDVSAPVGHEVKKDKRKKKKRVELEVPEEEDEIDEKVPKKKKGKGKRKDTVQDESAEDVAEVAVVDGSAEVAGQGTKDKKKKKDKASVMDDTDKARKQEKKRKRIVADIDTVEAEAETSESKPKKKKTKAQDGPDISIEAIDADEALGDSAKKALIYVHQHSTSHLDPSPSYGEAWKFNKARQNWLVKHVWELDQVPETYLTMAVGYLRTIQGKGRAHLIDVAKKHSQPKPAPTVQDPEERDQVEQTVDPENGEHVQITVETVESGTKRVGFAESTEEAPEKSDEAQADEERGRVRAERAKTILKALGAR